jgi:hypothetical protein
MDAKEPPGLLLLALGMMAERLRRLSTRREPTPRARRPVTRPTWYQADSEDDETRGWTIVGGFPHRDRRRP